MPLAMSSRIHGGAEGTDDMGAQTVVHNVNCHTFNRSAVGWEYGCMEGWEQGAGGEEGKGKGHAR